MKATELQIGDYVNYRGQIIKVTSLYDKGGSNEVGWSDKEYEWVNGRCIEPIPLTPEILEKNGFEWTTRKSYMVACIGTVRMIWGFYKDCLSISDHSDDGECQISSLKCKFVHELQHTLRLCGIDKTIEL